MSDGNSVLGDDPIGDAVGTTGLFLIVTAVIAFAVCVGGLGLAGGGFALTAGLVALFSFAASIACFVAENRRLHARECLIATQRPLSSSSEGQTVKQRFSEPGSRAAG